LLSYTASKRHAREKQGKKEKNTNTKQKDAINFILLFVYNAMRDDGLYLFSLKTFFEGFQNSRLTSLFGVFLATSTHCSDNGVGLRLSFINFYTFFTSFFFGCRVKRN